jgi:predicted Rossmann-fold nucleotide-binding protein
VLNFFLRLERLIFDSDAYIVLNGGIGTITELGLTWSLLQTHGVPSRPLVLIGEHWAALMEAFRAHCIIQPADYDLVCLVDTVDEAVSLIRERVK